MTRTEIDRAKRALAFADSPAGRIVRAVVFVAEMTSLTDSGMTKGRGGPVSNFGHVDGDGHIVICDDGTPLDFLPFGRGRIQICIRYGEAFCVVDDLDALEAAVAQAIAEARAQ